MDDCTIFYRFVRTLRDAEDQKDKRSHFVRALALLGQVPSSFILHEITTTDLEVITECEAFDEFREYGRALAISTLLTSKYHPLPSSWGSLMMIIDVGHKFGKKAAFTDFGYESETEY